MSPSSERVRGAVQNLRVSAAGEKVDQASWWFRRIFQRSDEGVVVLIGEADQRAVAEHFFGMRVAASITKAVRSRWVAFCGTVDQVDDISQAGGS